MDDNVIKIDSNHEDLRRLNLTNKIFHEFMKKAKKVGGGVNNWINEEVFQRVEKFTINKYKEGSIEKKLYNEVSENLRSFVKSNQQNSLTRNQFYQFWVETLNNKI
ncbi:MAG: hypothetical protein ACFE9L_13030 [Candidatus Hodarchaeota archaeon]